MLSAFIHVEGYLYVCVCIHGLHVFITSVFYEIFIIYIDENILKYINTYFMYLQLVFTEKFNLCLSYLISIYHNVYDICKSYTVVQYLEYPSNLAENVGSSV